MNGNGPPDPRDFGDEAQQRIESFFDWFRERPFALLTVFVLLVIVPLSLTLFFQVDRDEEAVILRFGKFARLVGPGLHWKLPDPIETSYILNTQRVFNEEFGYRSDGTGRRGNQRRMDREALMLTGDLGVARVEWDIQYRKAEPKKFLFNIRNEEKILREASFAAMRRIVGDWNATEVITTARQQIAQQVREELQQIMDSYRSGILIVDVLIRSSEPPEPVVPAFKEVDSARQDRERFRNEALQQQETIINETQGRVEQMISEAQGDSAAIINRALGDARRFEKILTQYQAAPRVTEDRMFLETMERAMRRSERVYVVDNEVKSILPLLDLEGSGQ